MKRKLLAKKIKDLKQVLNLIDLLEKLINEIQLDSNGRNEH
jgi:hypothetical protein